MAENRAPEHKTPESPDTNGTGALQPTQRQKTAGERFMDKVIAEFGSGVGDIALTNFQKRLAQNYFIGIDAVLQAAEIKRLKQNENNRNHQYDNSLAYTWSNIDMSLLARTVVAKARLGLDPAQKNHVSMVPFKNNATQKYGIGFIDGYRGLELTAKKYGADVPDAVIVELVYTRDNFKSIKKSATNPLESYEFEIVDDFDRGEIRGGFYYHAYKNNPEKNKLVVMTLKDILKRKPAHASTEFWGGEKDVYDGNGRKTGQKETVEGWFEKMCWKTVYRAAYGDITIDSQKIDADYLHLKQIEATYTEAIVAAEIEGDANTEVIDVDYSNIQTDPETGEVIEHADEDPPENSNASDAPAPVTEADGQTTLDGAAPQKQSAGKSSKPKAGGDPY